MTGDVPADVPGIVRVSLLVTAAFTAGWMVWGFREYRRTGRGTWLWMGLLLAVALIMVLLQYLR